MPQVSDVSCFVPFRELDPSRGSQCIYLTQKGARCRNNCSKQDHARATTLRNDIIATAGETADLTLLSEYVLWKCCPRARHRSRVANADLLTPLALRWQNEILVDIPSPTAVNSIVGLASDAAPLTPGAIVMPLPNTQVARLADRQLKIDSDLINAASPVDSVTDSPRSTPAPPPVADQFCRPPSQIAPRYNLRSRVVPVPVTATAADLGRVQQPRSEFEPHKPNSRHTDSVFSKLRAPLQKRDWSVGSVYGFTRDSSPGHVKIGWTEVSVTGRLRKWSKCGYHPNLICSEDDLPHAQRVETLVHHELINEWRRERMCKGAGCGKSHQEWFEVTNERAILTVSIWAAFMREAQPYDARGYLKDQWVEIIQSMDRRKELITGQRMLECSRALAPEIPAPVIPIYSNRNPWALAHQPISEEAPRRRNPVEVSPSQAMIARKGTPYEQAALLSSEPLLPKASTDATPFAQQEQLKQSLELLRKAILQVAYGLRNERLCERGVRVQRIFAQTRP